MTLSTPYFPYGGCHDAKDYPGATDTQSGFTLPMDMYDQDIDFLGYSDKYVPVHPISAASKPLTLIIVSTRLKVTLQVATAARHHH